jgi:hypothetical protein
VVISAIQCDVAADVPMYLDVNCIFVREKNARNWG